MTGERRLWAAVVLRAIGDLSSERFSADAEAWFFSADFASICDFLEIAPARILGGLGLLPENTRPKER